MTVVLIAIGVAVALIGAGVIASVHTEELRRDNDKMMTYLNSLRTDLEKLDEAVYQVKGSTEYIDETLTMYRQALEEIKRNTTKVQRPRKYKLN